MKTAVNKNVSRNAGKDISDKEIIEEIKRMRSEPGYYSSIMKEVDLVNEMRAPFIIKNPRGAKSK